MNVWLHPTPQPRLDDDERAALVELGYAVRPNVDRSMLRRLAADALAARPGSTWRLTARGRRALDEGSP